MANCSRKWRKESTNQLLFFIALFFLHIHLHISASIVKATTSVYIVYMGERHHEDPATIKKSHHETLSTLLGRYMLMISLLVFLESGTSMACPHVTGVAALIKSSHPDWSPFMCKIAASQTGTDGQNIIAEGSTRKPADPFDIGGGHANPVRAANPGLIYNMSSEDYIQFLCSLGYSTSAITNLTMSTTSCMKKRHFGMDLNLPSISIPNLMRTVTVSRTVTNVGSTNSVYKALVQPPHGVRMMVQPQTLTFNSTTSVLSFTVTFTSPQKVHGDYSFGSLTWSDGEHFVRSPVAVRAIIFESYADI